jgi:hypothetical protein
MDVLLRQLRSLKKLLRRRGATPDQAPQSQPIRAAADECQKGVGCAIRQQFPGVIASWHSPWVGVEVFLGLARLINR